MATSTLYPQLTHRQQVGQKCLAVLVDPDKASAARLTELIDAAVSAKVDYFFVGGSLLVSNTLEEVVQQIKTACNIPVVLFPGSPQQITPLADAILLLSVISGRNPELLIGQHVLSAPALQQSKLEILPTGYILVDGGIPTTVSYISQTTPLPHHKPDIAACTALAGEMLGLRITYLDAGSGALQAVSEAMITAVRRQTSTPIIVGGGIRTPQQATAAAKAGADIVVVGNVLEQEPALLPAIARAVHALNKPSHVESRG